MRNVLFMILTGLCSVLSIRRLPTDALKVFPATGSLDRSADPEPLAVWSPTESLVEPVRHSTGFSNWTVYQEAVNFSCTGFLRFGNEEVYSAPIISSVENLACNRTNISDYLWSEQPPQLAGTKCQCRQPLPMILSRESGGKRLCFAAPSADNGWGTWAGLLDCDSPQSLLTPVMYHGASGHIRNSGNCLTATPYSAGNSSKDTYRPWLVVWLPCLNVAKSTVRQAWDVPYGVGIPLMEINLPPPAGTQLRPTGSRGIITLRDSGDIGTRCLDITYESRTAPVLMKGTFLDANICNDARIVEADKGIWRFFQAAGTSNSQASYEFKECTSPECSECGLDSELKYGSLNQILSAPSSFPPKWTCDEPHLKALFVPDIEGGKCYCQEHNYFRTDKQAPSHDISNTIGLSVDNLPNRARLSFPARTKISPQK